MLIGLRKSGMPQRLGLRPRPRWMSLWSCSAITSASRHLVSIQSRLLWRRRPCDSWYRTRRQGSHFYACPSSQTVLVLFLFPDHPPSLHVYFLLGIGTVLKSADYIEFPVVPYITISFDSYMYHQPYRKLRECFYYLFITSNL